jgi:hypothetical protein
MTSLKSWFAKSLPSESVPRPERRATPGLLAIHPSGNSSKMDAVRDISETGLYLVTEERWPNGASVPLILTCIEKAEKVLPLRCPVEARTVRVGQDGIGLKFVLPEGADLWLWKKADEGEPKRIIEEFRATRALDFLSKICPSASHEIELLFSEGLSNIQIANVVEIALRAEQIRALDSDRHRSIAPENLVLPIIKHGSWAEVSQAQQLWAGLLASSCTLEGRDQSNSKFLKVLCHIATIHARIFVAACTRATKVVSASGTVSALPLICTAEEMSEIAEAHDLMKIDRNLLQLFDLGLLPERVKSSFFSFSEDADITPTPFALELFARCSGHRGATQDFYQSAANANTLTFAR